MRTRVAGAIALGAIFPLLLLTVLDFPRVAYDIDHDLSSSASIEYFASRAVQFGVDLIQNVGPLGWVHQSSIYAGFLNPEKVVLSALTRGALALLILWAATRFERRAARVAWFVAILAPLPFGAPSVDFIDLYHDGWAYLNVYLAGLALLATSGRRHSVIFALPPLALLAFLALEKHTLLAVACFAVAAAMLERLQRPGDRTPLAIGTLFIAGVAALWVLLGQQIANLPAFALGVVRFGSGYNEAMALLASPSATRLGVVVFTALGALIALRAIERSQSIAKSLLDTLLLVTIWKHGFVRGDPAHVVIFFHTAVPLALLFGFAHEQPGPSPRPTASRVRDGAVGALAAGVVALCFVAILGSFPGTSYAPSRVADLWTRNLAWLRGPSWRTGELAAELRANEFQYQLPPMAKIVGSSTIDFFGAQPGWVLLNHLNYVSRPVPIPFAASNAYLRRRNEAFYRAGAASPSFVLVQLDRTSRRLATLDDGLALGALLDNYAPVSGGGELLLLKRREPEQMRSTAERTLLAESHVALGEELSLDAFAGRWVWLEADVRPSLLGRLRSAALRPAAVQIALVVDGSETPVSREYAPSMGSSGFLVSPYIGDETDLTKAYWRGGTLLHSVRSVRFHTTPENRRFFAPRVRVRILAGEAPRN